MSDKTALSELRRKADIFHANYIKAGDNDCWEWTGSRGGVGYGRFWAAKNLPASRAAMMLFIDREIPADLEVCHACDNRLCVNPAHLWIGTPKQNSQDRVAKGRQSRIFGEEHAGSKLTNEAVIAIRESAKGHRPIARDYGVSESLVRQVRARISWPHIPSPTQSESQEMVGGITFYPIQDDESESQEGGRRG